MILRRLMAANNDFQTTWRVSREPGPSTTFRKLLQQRFTQTYGRE